MSASLVRRRRTRVSLVISISVVFVAVASFWATSQRASVLSVMAGASQATAPLALPDKGGIAPEASIITVNSLSDVANGSDGLCTLREAITSANTDVASGVAAGECVAGSSTGSDSINLAVNGTINLTAG